MHVALAFRTILLGLLIAIPSALAGDLNPPVGPVTPTMKTLTEVEPRVAVNALNTPGNAAALFEIKEPGSYYLTGNISGVAGKEGIRITASGVTLDLQGFTLTGVSGAPFDDIFADNNGSARVYLSAVPCQLSVVPCRAPPTSCSREADNNHDVNFADITNVLTNFGLPYP